MPSCMAWNTSCSPSGERAGQGAMGCNSNRVPGGGPIANRTISGPVVTGARRQSCQRAISEMTSIVPSATSSSSRQPSALARAGGGDHVNLRTQRVRLRDVLQRKGEVSGGLESRPRRFLQAAIDDAQERRRQRAVDGRHDAGRRLTRESPTSCRAPCRRKTRAGPSAFRTTPIRTRRCRRGGRWAVPAPAPGPCSRRCRAPYAARWAVRVGARPRRRGPRLWRARSRELRLSVGGNEDVFRLDVAVDEIAAVRGRETAGDLGRQIDHPAGGQPFLAEEPRNV